MSNDTLTCFCVFLGLAVYVLMLSAWLNSGLRDELSMQKAKIYGLEFEIKHMKSDIKRLEERHWEVSR